MIGAPWRFHDGFDSLPGEAKRQAGSLEAAREVGALIIRPSCADKPVFEVADEACPVVWRADGLMRRGRIRG